MDLQLRNLQFGRANIDFKRTYFYDPRTGEPDELGETAFRSLKGFHGLIKQHIPAYEEAPDSVTLRGERYVSPSAPNDPSKDLIGFQVLANDTALLGSTLGITELSTMGWLLIKHMVAAQMTAVTRMLALVNRPEEIQVGVLAATTETSPPVTLGDLLTAAGKLK